MDSGDDAINNENVRRTRSGKIVRTPPAVKTPVKKTRKKVVLMEVEVSEEESEEHNAIKTEPEQNNGATIEENHEEVVEEASEPAETSDMEVSQEIETLVKEPEIKEEVRVELETPEETNGITEDIDETTEEKQPSGEPDAENISEDELPTVQAVKVPETEEVSDEELPGPKRAELPADTEVVSEDELPTVKKEANKRKLVEGDYDPGSPTSEGETPAKKASLENTAVKEEEKNTKPKKLPELDKYWKAVNDDPTDFTGWTYLLQYVDQENDMEAAREAYDAFLSHYPYCYGYWRKYADYEKRKGNKKKCEEVFERGLKAIPLSVDLWIHYLTYVKTTKPDDEDYIRSQFERAIAASGLEFRSDRLWDSYIKWETEGKRLQHVTSIYDRLFTTPTQGYTTHFENFQEHITSNPPNKVVEVDEFLALRKEVRHMLKHDAPNETKTDNSDVPPGEDDASKAISTDEETKAIRERIISIRRKIHKNTVAAVTARWNFEEGIKRPYFHVKPLERCQLKNWQEYLDFEIEQGDQVRIVVLFERCLIACALYEEFWLKFVHYLESLKDPELQPKIRDVYERACTIHHLKKPNLHLQWAMFEESVGNFNRAAEILVNLEKSVPNVLQIAYRRINLERRRSDNEKCAQLYEHYINNSKNKMISSNIAIKYSRFVLKVLKNTEKALEILRSAITKDPNNPRLYLQLIDLTLQQDDVAENVIVELIDSFLEKETADADQKVLFAQRKLEYLEDFGADIQSVQKAYDDYQKYIKQSKETGKKKESKNDAASAGKKDKTSNQQTSASSYGSYGNYGNSSAQGSYQYSGSQTGQYNYSYGQGDQYQYQGWQYPQGSYSGYNQWGSYGGGYSY
ncbi:pre-mRNA-processing factor 39 isoform X2 [Tribolium castaneum]|uniref:pre-mRNA-processing factor 39 isoform X2 n=1 Tax=Tribolium castaneum TaxID=7070 RepID=UPI00046C3AB4|nr:PREDICTED: pre-mRNA-processing factor 39 isoform X2 [Tribolium castaneum]|eukprot:XP_008195405.1 PREDICTED: pre-mRNA-processing factor 39 isoform X2 [Tribolium castaneum]